MTDSTRVKRRSVFVALKGERHDGHRFIPDAIERGAACVIAARAVSRAGAKQATIIGVPDTLRALGKLAHFRREQFNPKVLAITGSNGKTTTKEMIAAIFEQATLGGARLRGRVLKTEGNFNNLVGLPLTLLRLRRRDKVAVVELGTNHPGEIQRLAEIADPDFGIITSVAPAHLEGLSSLAGVAREKGALYRHVRANGAIAVNLDDERVQRLAANFPGKKITYGRRGAVRALSWRVRGRRGIEVDMVAGRQRARLRLHYLGAHNVSNALGAAALSLAAGVTLESVRQGLARARPFSMRMEVESWRGIGVINDAYNANPASMLAALKTLTEVPGRGRRYAVLGDMFELGRHSQTEHRRLGKAAAAARIDGLYVLGEQAATLRKGAIAAGMPPASVVIGKDHADLASRLGAVVRPGDWLLFKGSRGMKMERVLDALKSGKV